MIKLITPVNGTKVMLLTDKRISYLAKERSEMNSHPDITPDGMKTLRNQLKIKSVLDLRCESEIVKDVYGGNYINISSKVYSEVLDDRLFIKRIFEFLTNEENYPVYYHCGVVRTEPVLMRF